MKRHIITTLLLVLLLASCGEKKDVFVIEGTINNLGGRPLYAVYEAHGRIVTDTLRPRDGKIAMEGSATECTPVQLYDVQLQPVARFYLTNGDRLELRGDAQQPQEMRLKGNGLNTDLWRLLQENYEAFTTLRTEQRRDASLREMSPSHLQALAVTDSIIIHYITHNRGSQLSAILLTDYLLRSDNYSLCDSLWRTLNADACPPFTVRTMQSLQERYTIEADNKRLPHLRFLDVNDTITFVNPRNARATLLYMWSSDEPRSVYYLRELARYAARYEHDRVQVVALSLDRDTARWHLIAEADSLPITHLWCEGAYNNRLIRHHNIDKLPVALLGDSTGLILVRTSALPCNDIVSLTDSLLAIPGYTIESPIIKP